MTSVERVLYYAEEVEQEASHNISTGKTVLPWPSKGKLELNSVVLRYRPELPPVLKGLSFTVNGGEKIGIVGR